jgi:hypothetical protein
MRRFNILLWFLTASAAAAQPLTVGSMPPNAIFGLGDPYSTAAVWSMIDAAHPATNNGTLNRATVKWSFTCTGAFKVAFLRPSSSGPTSFMVVAVRGPFDATGGRNTVTLSPPVSVNAGDLLALIQLKPGVGCGGPGYEVQPAGQGASWLSLNDVSADGALASTAVLQTQFAFAAIAYNAAPVLVHVLPAAGAVAGSGGSFFRTSLQIFNYSPGGEPVTGMLVFHPAGASASANDPSLPFSIAFRQTLSFADVVAAMGTSGLGSLDVLTDEGQQVVVAARIFNDAGATGTSGFTEEGLDPALARRFISGQGGIDGILIIPADTTNFRMNVGVRTLDAGAKLTITTFDASGAVLNARSDVAYQPNYFEQTTASAFTGLSTLPPGSSILVRVSTGAAFVYGTVTDNRTQDSSMRMAEFH